jgi:hypothetical protein
MYIDLTGAAWIAEVLRSDENEEGLVMMYNEVRLHIKTSPYIYMVHSMSLCICISLI